MNIKQILNPAPFYAKNVKYEKLTPNRSKQEKKMAEKSVPFLMKIVQKNSFKEEKSM